jgi:MYXO-CTERM domain-containing protein
VKRTLRFLPLALVSLVSSSAYAQEPPSFSAYLSAAPRSSPAVAPVARSSGAAVGFVASVDAQRGVPAFFWAAPQTQVSPASYLGSEQLARAYLELTTKTYGLSRAASSTAYVKHVHDTGRGGVIVAFGQRIDGVEVFQTEMKVLMNRQGALVAIGGNLHADATLKKKNTPSRAFTVRDTEAIAKAFHDRYAIQLAPSDLTDARREKLGYHYYDLKATPSTQARKLAFNRSSRVKKIFYPMPDRIRPAYYLELDVARQDTGSSDRFGYVIAADTGELLMRRNLTQDVAFNYKVWTDAAEPYSPLDGPHAEFTPHPTGLPDGSYPDFILPNMVSIEGFNTNPNALPDPWLDAGATQTSGNNCDAYADLAEPDGFSGADVRATTTSANTFDRTYDTALGPQSSSDQIMAAVTQLFYSVNWLHDFYYDSGFNEPAGNAQVVNFGRGGVEGDPLLAEAQDYSGQNNANMTTPADGQSPIMQMYLWTVPGPDRDSTIDNSIVAHEWGHYIHHRLVSCGTEQCSGESEGWGDFIALMLAIDEGEDVAAGTFADSIYSTPAFGDAGYFGIRRFPYSRDMTKNGLTFKHVENGQALPAGPLQDAGFPNFEVHNAGEVWAQMLFQAYTEMLLNGGHSFTEARRRMADYIVAGMKMAPPNPTFTEQRDGILASVFAADPADFILLAQGFATRGAGSCADSPPRNSADGSGVVEDFTLSGRQNFASLTVDDSILSCDGDGFLDAEETGKLSVAVLNAGAVALANTGITVTTTAPGVSFPNGNTATIVNVAPYSTTTATVDIALDSSFVTISDIDFTVDIANANACAANVQATASVRLNFDETLMSSATDTVEAPTSAWTKWSAPPFPGFADDIWSRSQQADGTYRWYGEDFPAHSDTAFESPDLLVSDNQSFVITFDHAYDFEASFEMGDWTYWDGGLIEITQDGGLTWEDIATYVDPGYTGTIAQVPGADNPLGARNGFVRQNAAWPNSDTVTLDLGSSFAGQTVKIRYRIGTDAVAGVPDYQGWFIDTIGFQGITNTPFPTIAVDPVGCNVAPVASAGPDQVVNEGDLVTLDASMSSDSDSDPLTFAWSQTVGPNAMLSDPAVPMPTFTAPQVTVDTMLTFAVAVDDGIFTNTDSVNVLVLDVSANGGAGGTGGGTGGMDAGGTGGSAGGDNPEDDGGCGCEVAGASSAPMGSGFASFFLAAALLLRRRRSGSRP